MPTTIAVQSLREAVSLLSQYGQRCLIIAGGTDVLAKMKRGAVLPEVWLNIQSIPELDYITCNQDGGFKIGALATIDSIAGSLLVTSKLNMLAQAASVLGTPAIRCQATMGGNLCNAAPSAELAPALLVLEAVLKLTGINGEQIIPLQQFFTGPGQTCLAPGSILTEIQIPALPPGSFGYYVKHSRSKGADLATVGIAVLVTLNDNIIIDVRIALGAVAPTPIRAHQAESILKGNKWNAELLEAAGQAAAHESSPIDDARGSADYRRKLVAVLVKRALTMALTQVKTES